LLFQSSHSRAPLEKEPLLLYVVTTN
jgi:hypothetical protein